MKASILVQVLIVGEDALTNAGLAAHVGSLTNYQLAGTGESAGVALELRAKLRPALAVLVLPLLGGDGAGLVRELARRSPKTRVVVIGCGERAENVQRAFRAGALGFVDRHDAPGCLAEAFARAVEGKIYASPRADEAVLTYCARQLVSVGNGTLVVPGDIAALSQREQTVYEMIGRDQGPTEIGRSLRIAVKTVETHQKRIREKLGLQSAEELRKHAMRWVGEQAAVNGSQKKKRRKRKGQG